MSAIGLAAPAAAELLPEQVAARAAARAERQRTLAKTIAIKTVSLAAVLAAWHLEPPCRAGMARRSPANGIDDHRSSPPILPRAYSRLRERGSRAGNRFSARPPSLPCRILVWTAPASPSNKSCRCSQGGRFLGP